MAIVDAKDIVRIQKVTSRNGGESLTERLLNQGIIFISGVVDEAASHAFMLQLLAVADADPDQELTVYINSQGGSVYDGLAMIDICRMIPNPVTTLGVGHCASMGAMLLACAAPRGRRKALPNCELMLHQPLSGVQGQATDIAIEAVHVMKLKERIYSMLAASTGQTVEKIAKDFDRNRWMTSEEALAYGLIDEIVQPAPLDLTDYDGSIPMPVRLAGVKTKWDRG